MPRNTRNSWGSNEPAGKGKRRLRWWADMHDGRGYTRHSKTITGSRRDGDEELARLRLAHGDDAPVPTVRECYETWYLPDIESRVAKNTLANYASSWRRYVEPTWADLPVTDVKPLDVQSWLLTMTKSQAEQASNVLSSVLEFAVRYEMLDRNPMRISYRMPTKVRDVDKSVYNLKQAIAVLDAARGSFAEPAIVAALFGSCRPGESLSPMVGEIKPCLASNGMDAAVFDLTRQIDHNGNVYEGMKTDTSARPIVFAGKVARRLVELQDERRSEGKSYLSDNGFGRAVSQQVLGEEWKRVAAKAGLKPIPFRNLRNSWRTYMSWELHIDEEKLEKMMGHKGRSVTERHYNRPNSGMFIDAVADAYKRERVLL